VLRPSDSPIPRPVNVSENKVQVTHFLVFFNLLAMEKKKVPCIEESLMGNTEETMHIVSYHL
jgi:hypothetical protein